MKSARPDKRDKQKNARKAPNKDSQPTPPGTNATATPPPSRDSTGHVADDEDDPPRDIPDQIITKDAEEQTAIGGGVGDDKSKKKKHHSKEKKKKSIEVHPNPEEVHPHHHSSDGGQGDAVILRPPIIKNLWQVCCDEVAAEFQEVNETMKKLGLPALHYTKDRRYSYSDYDDQTYPHPQTCKVKDFLDFYVFPTLIPGIQALVEFGKENRVFGDPNYPFNALDFIVDYIYNNNPRSPNRQEHPTPLMEIPFVKDWMKKFPRTPFPRWMYMSTDQAATIIESAVKGFLVRVRPEIQRFRDFWKDRKKKAEAKKQLADSKKPHTGHSTHSHHTAHVPHVHSVHPPRSQSDHSPRPPSPHSGGSGLPLPLSAGMTSSSSKSEDATTSTISDEAPKYSDPCLAIAFDYLYNNKTEIQMEPLPGSTPPPEDAPFVYPKSPFPKWMFITDDQAARVIQSAYRGYRIRNRPDVFKWRGMWKEYKRILEEQAAEEAEEEAEAAAIAAIEEMERQEAEKIEAERQLLEQALSQYEDIDFPSTATIEEANLTHSQTCDVCLKFKEWVIHEEQVGHCYSTPPAHDSHHVVTKPSGSTDQFAEEEDQEGTDDEMEDPFEDYDEGEDDRSHSTTGSTMTSGQNVHDTKAGKERKRSVVGGSKSDKGKLSNTSTINVTGAREQNKHGVQMSMMRLHNRDS